MDFFSSLAKDIGKFVEEVTDTIQETVAEIANADDFYETRNEPVRRSASAIKEDLNEWTLLEDPALPSEETTNSSSNTNGPSAAHSNVRSLSGKKSGAGVVGSGEYSERVVRVPQERGLAGWLDQGPWIDGAWDSAENKERFRQLVESRDAQGKVELARCAFEYGVPFDYKLRVYRRLLPSGNYLSQEQFQALKNQHLRDGIPRAVLEDIADDMKYANRIRFFHEMEVFDILEEVLYLIYLTQFSGPEDRQRKKARKARKEKLDLDQQYPQGLAYVCCPLLFLLLRQEADDDATNETENETEKESIESSGGRGVARKSSTGADSLASSGAYLLSESQKILARPAYTQEEKIIKRKLIDFYLQKVQLDLYNLVASLYQIKDSGFIALHQNPLEYVFALNDVLDEACPEITRYLNSMEVDLSGMCFSWMAHVLLPHWEKLQVALQVWDRYIAVLREAGLFHACVCASALIFLKRKLLEQNTPEYIQCFLQHPPLTDVTAAELDRIVADALRLFRDRKKGSGGISFEDYCATDGAEDARKTDREMKSVAEDLIAEGVPEQKQPIDTENEGVEEKKPEATIVESAEVKPEEMDAAAEVQDEAPHASKLEDHKEVSEAIVEDGV